MAANVVGAFTVIDRASRPIRKIRDEAIKADRAVARLGNSLDRIGTRQQQQQMGRVVGQMRQVAKGAGTASTATRDLNQQLRQTGSTRQVQQLQRTIQQLQNMVRQQQNAGNQQQRLNNQLNAGTRGMRAFGGATRGAGMALKLSLIPMLGLAAQGIGALVVGIGALIPDLTSLLGLMAPLGAGLAGLAAAMATVKLATGDMGKALGGNKEALKSLTPQARAFVRTLKQYAPVMKDLRREAQQGLFPGLDLALRRIVKAAPVVQSVLRNMGGTLGRIASSAARWATRPGFLRDFEMLTGQGGTLLQRGARVLMNLGDAMRHVFRAAQPFTDWLTRSVEAWSENVRGAALMGRQTGSLARWFRRARSDLEQFSRISKNTFGALGGTLDALRPTSEFIFGGLERVTKEWRDWAQSANGREDMREYFAKMVTPLREIAGFTGDLFKAFGRLSAGSGFTASVRALRQAIPSLERGLNAMAEGLGPAVVGALANMVELFGTLGQHGGPLSNVVNLFGGMVRAVNTLLETVPGLGTVFATALSMSLITKFAAGLTMLAGKWRAVGAAAAGATRRGGNPPPVPPGPGPVPPGGGPGPGPGPAPSRWQRYGTAGLMAGAVGAGVAGSMVGGGVGGALSGAGTGLILGATIGSAVPVIGTAAGAAVGALGGGILGYLSGNRGAEQNARLTGEQQAVEFLARGANAEAIRGRVEDIQQRLAAQRVTRVGDPATTGGRPIGTLTKPVVTGDERKRLQAQLDQLRPALKVQVQLEREQAVRAAQDAGSRLAAGLGQAFNVYNRRFGLNKSMRMLRGDVVRELNGLGPVGRKAMGQNVLEWAREQARQNPKLWRQVRRLTRRMEQEFEDLGQKVKIVNGRILDGSKEDWRRIEKALADPAEKARQRVSDAFTRMQREAATALTLMGWSRKDANAIIRTAERSTGGDVGAAQGIVASGKRYEKQAKSYRARGGRISGSGLMDTVPVAPGVMAAPGELITNRHTERRVDQMLSMFGTSLGREVARENKPHYAAMGARVGMGDMQTRSTAHAPAGSRDSGLKGAKPHFADLMSDLRRMFGGKLYVMSGLRPGSRVAGSGRLSNHATGDAIDISWPGLESASQSRPPETLNPAGAAALDAVYAYLQRIPSPPRRDLLWRTMQGGNHYNHVHYGADPGNWSGRLMAGGAGGGALQQIALRGFQSGVGGVAGRAATGLMEAGRMALEAKVNRVLAGGGGGPAGAAGGSLDQWLTQALRITGQYSPANLAALRGRAMQESGGNPLAVNNWDSNAARGTPSKGLLQTIGPTFDAYKAPGMGDIWNPVHNSVAAIRYMMARYGHIVGPSSTGYAKGGRVPDWGGWFASGGRRRFNRPTMIGVGEGGVPEDVEITPVRGGSRGGGGGRRVVLNIHPGAIVVNGGGRGAKEVADEVMERLVAIMQRMGLEPEEAIS